MKNHILQYIEGLQSGDYKKISNLFSGEAVVHSPLYGTLFAKDFFKALLSDTQQSEIILLGIFNNPDKPNVVAAHLYTTGHC